MKGMSSFPSSLPINDVLPGLQDKLARNLAVVLAAETGSGKTTVAPLALLDEPWLAGRKIIMLEPRRLAARMAARRMSHLAGENVGGLIGYRIRFESRVGPRTRIEVVTEGVFLRMIQQDPGLTGVGLVIFDEFHERSLTCDLALAFCLDVQEMRDDLKLLVMSATMDTQRLASFLGRAPVIVGEGRAYPVEIRYLARPSADHPVPRTLKAISRALAEHEGDILVFLPGAGEIRAVQQQVTEDVLCLPLYGNLPRNEQDRVFAPTDRQRLVLATPIAETSLTIEGITVVIDTGLARVPRFSPTSGLTTLQTINISRASAGQRAGRAGRLGPGTCYRLWTEAEHFSRLDFLPPEIVGADLAPLLLAVLQWGVRDPSELRWLDPPRPGAVKQARELLTNLGAVDPKGALTDIGRSLAALPLHPRLGIMLLRGREQKQAALACRLAALLQNRDLFRGRDRERSADIEDRLEVLRLFERAGDGAVRERGADSSLCGRVLREAMQYERLLGSHDRVEDFSASGTLLAAAYPDRIGRKKGGNQYLLASGRAVSLPVGDHLGRSEFLVAAQVDGGARQGRVFLAASLERGEISRDHGHLLSREELVRWNGERVEAAVVTRFGAVEFAREDLKLVDPEQVRQCLLAGIRETGLDSLAWDRKSQELRARMQCAHLWDPVNWPDMSDAALLSDLSWLEPWLDNVTTLARLRKIDLTGALLARLSWQEQQQFEHLVPTHLQVPSGSRIRLRYSPGEPPVLAVRLQEMFGATRTPAVFGGRVPVVVHLLSPASRPIQVTSDLAGFWRTTYHEVKKELKGRYPKHYWPDDPLTAKATSRVRPRKK